MPGESDLRIYNTLSRKKEAFLPLDDARIRVYVCGPTVYDFAHIGNARPVIVFDLLFRLLRHIYGPRHVTYVRNITDVDDKIIDRARRDFPDLDLNEAIGRVTGETADQFHEDVKELGCLPPTHEPRATEYIDSMAAMIQKLLESGHAYVAQGENGFEILFDIASMADYGQLSKRKLEDQQAGARVAVEAHKKNPGDFVLWKESSQREPGWTGTFEGRTIRGRPGWHIECSAMAKALLGETFDIHGGGLDLVFPHHENEIAQSRCAHDTAMMARYWMHNGYLQLEGRKMSKSEGNFVTIHDLLSTETFGGKSWDGEVLRLAMLMTHYREPIDFSVARLREAEDILDGWYRAVGETGAQGEPYAEILAALKDDLDTPKALMELARLKKQSATDPQAGIKLKTSAGLLGLLPLTESQRREKLMHRLSADNPEAHSDIGVPNLHSFSPKEIEKQKQIRLDYIRQKNWAEADRIRAELAEKGIQLMDFRNPETGERDTKWEVKR